MADKSAEARRARCSALFNNRHFADVAEAVLAALRHGDELVTAREIASSTGLADSVVRSVLLRLVEGDVLLKTPRMGGGRSPQHYQVIAAEQLELIVTLAPLQPVKVRITER